MSAINSNNKLKNQHSSTSRFLPFSDEYRKLKKVLLKSMFGLLSKAEVSARNAIGIQTIQSIQHCKEWLADCLESLQQTKQDLVKNESVTTNIEFDDSNDTNTGRKYIVSLKKLIHSYKRYRFTRRPKAHKMKMKKKFKEILTENIEGLRFVIKMMEVFIRKAKKNLMKQKKEIWNTLGLQALKQFKIEQKQRKSIRDSIFGDENENDLPYTTKKHRRPHHKKIIKQIQTESHELDQPIIIPKRKKETASIEKQSITSLDKAIHTGKKLLTTQSFTKGPVSADQVNLFTMQKAASFIIHNLFASKTSPFEKIFENRVDIRHSDDQLDEVWRELISEHNRLVSIPGKRTLSELKDDLTTFYLNKMQLAFLEQLTSPEEKSSRGFGHALRSNKSFVLDIKQMPLGNAAIHQMLYDTQMKKLRSGRHNPDIEKMLKIIMSDGLPKSRSSQELLKLYKSDPQHFNVLLMSSANNITHRGASLLNLIEHKFERVKEQLARQRRRVELIQSSASYRNSDPINSADKSGSLSHRTELLLDDEYCKEVRERWSKYFAEQEKTPTMLHLEEERRKKTERFIKLKEDRRLQKLEKANNLKKKDMRPITALYTSPRLTHRTRKAIDRLAEEAPFFPMVNENLNKSEQNIRPIPSVTSIGEYETGPTLADIILDSQSMTSCCSKCCNQADVVHYGPVLERFFRTHDEIIAHGNNVSNSLDFSDEDSDFCGVQYQE